MSPTRLALDEETVDGQVVREVAWFDDGTVEVFESGVLVESRQQTEVEAARFAPPIDQSADERVAALEAQNAALIAALAKATSLAQIRAAAADLA